MTLHIQIRVEGKLDTFIPRDSTIVSLSKHACLCFANGLVVAVAGVSATQMNEAINGDLFVVDALAIVFVTASEYNNHVHLRLINDTNLAVAKHNSAISGVLVGEQARKFVELILKKATS